MINIQINKLTFALLKNRTASLISLSFVPNVLTRPTSVTSKFYHREVSKSVEANLRAEDKIPASYNIIYRAPLKTYFKVTYYTTFTGLAMIIPVVGTSIYISGLENFPVILYNTEVVGSIGELGGLFGAFLLVSTQIGSIVFKYPLRIYKNSEKKHYIAVYQHILPWKHKNEEFSAGELKKSRSIMPWRDNMYAFRKRRALLLEDYFTRPADLGEMLNPDSSNKTQST
uniref:Uncharacterized protein n=1 Tax=Rhodnius prolixus TaxID=13249 RepID=R4FM73_RHOPR